MVYSPEEDSYMLEKEVAKYINKLSKKQKQKIKAIRVLDMGSGTGIQALACIRDGIKKENLICADIDSEAIKLLKKQKLNPIKSDLFSNIKNKGKNKFDLIIFNAPYLPEDKNGFDKGKDTTAGKKGNEIILRFLREAKDFLSQDGKILLLFSSLSKPKAILSYAKWLGYKAEKLAEKKLFFEKLFVYAFSLI